MTEQTRSFEKLAVSIEERFELISVLVGTLTAQAFSAVDVQSRQNVTLWKTRGPLAQAEVERFKSRLFKMHGAVGIQPILWSGVDSFNRGFAVLPACDGWPIHCPARTSKELEARFKASVSIIEALHDESIVCGDLCLDSFFINGRGEVSLFAVLGDVNLEYEEEEFNKAQYLAFRPPEQGLGGIQQPSVDVYALAWLGEGLFTVAECTEEKGEYSGPPIWLKNILRETSSKDLRRKTNTAAALRLLVESHSDDTHETHGRSFALMEVPEKEDGKTAENLEQDSGDNPDEYQDISQGADGKEGHSDQDNLGRKSEGLGSRRDSADEEEASCVSWRGIALSRLSNRVLILWILILIVPAGLAIFYLDSQGFDTQIEKERAAKSAPVEADRLRLREWYVSDEPAVHNKIVKEFQDAASSERRAELLRTLVFRSRRLGLGRSADVALRFFEKGGGQQGIDVKATRPLVLRVLDPSISQNDRLEELAKLYALDPQLAAVLTASLALDTGEAEPFRGILARAVADQVGIPQGGEHSPFALILLIPQAHDLFSEDIVEINDRIPSSDLSWLLEELGKKGQPEVSTVAQLAYRRKIITGALGVFLRELQRGAALSQGLRSSLVSGALGKLSENDVNRFGEWYGQGAPRVLEAGILTATNSKIKEAAFQALGTKAISDQYVAKVLEFLRSVYADESAKYGGVVAVLALRDVVDTATIDRELEKINDAPHLSALLKELVKGAPPEMLEAIINRYSASMDPLDLVDLLGHPSQDVRIAAVSHLSQVNDIMLLKLISQSYDEEKDPKVRAVYRQNISIIRERANSGA